MKRTKDKGMKKLKAIMMMVLALCLILSKDMVGLAFGLAEETGIKELAVLTYDDDDDDDNDDDDKDDDDDKEDDDDDDDDADTVSSASKKSSSRSSSNSKSSKTSTSKTQKTEKVDTTSSASQKATKTETKAIKIETKAVEKAVRELTKEEAVKVKALRTALKALISDLYTDEELLTLVESIQKIKAMDSEIGILDVDSISGSNIQFKFDTPPVVKEGRTLVPVAALAKGFGLEVSWDPAIKKVTLQKEGKTIELWIDQNVALVDGTKVELDVPAEIMNQRTIVPLRFISEALNLEVKWDATTKSIELLEAPATPVVETPVEQKEEKVDTVTGASKKN